MAFWDGLQKTQQEKSNPPEPGFGAKDMGTNTRTVNLLDFMSIIVFTYNDSRVACISSGLESDNVSKLRNA